MSALEVTFELLVVLLKTIGTVCVAIFRCIIPEPLKSVREKVILVTGSGGGLGRQLAQKLALLGARVVLVDVDEVRELGGKGERGDHVTCVISVNKLDDCSLLRLVSLSTFLLDVLTQTREQLSMVSECLNQMHKEENSFVKEKKTTNKSSRKKNQKNIANSLSPTAKSTSEYMREYRARKKTLQNTVLMLSLRDGNAIETLLMTAQMNTDLVNHPLCH
ncbi:uncharacterized protein TNCV_2880851 [Trichonephila clavipes]|nr:uncharacterized protein TNCV_2880851 [Trichonephila clavipes]